MLRTLRLVKRPDLEEALLVLPSSLCYLAPDEWHFPVSLIQQAGLELKVASY